MLTTKSKLFGFLLLIILLFISACSEDPIAPQKEHVKAVGMVFYTSGIEIARVFKGVTEDTLTVASGSLSDHIDIKFIAEDGTEFSVDKEAPQTLAWEFGNSSIANIWQHEGEEGSFAFHLRGLQEGNTDVEFFVMHVDHSDFRSGKIPVKVTKADGGHDKAIGLELSDEETGNILVSIKNSQVVGQLSVNNSDTTEHMEVEFFDANGVHFQPSVPPHKLLVEVADSSIVQITGQVEMEPWAFKIAGVSKGTTQITIKILHNGNVGATFEPIPVTIN